MQVRKRLRINVIVSVLAAVIIIGILLAAGYRIKNAVEASTLSDEILSSVYQRSEFRGEYMKTTNERAKEQWFVKHKQIGLLLQSASEKFRDAKDKIILDHMLKDQESIGKLFSAIVENREKALSDANTAAFSRDVEDRLTIQLTMRRYNAILDAHKLQETGNRYLFSALELSGLGIIFVIAVLTVSAVINLWTMSRFITERVSRLRDGATLIGEGNLNYRIGIKGDDEFAELSDEFDGMTAKLRFSYENLEKEIDERKRVDRELRRTATLLNETQSIARVGGWELDLRDNALYWTDETFSIHDTSPSEYVPTVESAIAFYAPASRPVISAAVRDAVEQGKEFLLELQLITAKGRLIWVETTGRVLLQDGHAVKVLGAFQDITERKRTEELRLSSAYHRSLLEASLDPLVTIDAKGKITDVNAATEKVTGRRRGELISTDFSDYFTEPDKARAGYQKVFREGSVMDYALEIRHLNGHITPVLYNAAVYRDEAGTVIGVFAAARDITELNKAEQEIQKLNRALEARVVERTAQLEAANRELEAFSYSVSHDLRSPLRSIVGFSQALWEDYADKLDADGIDSLKRIVSATQRMGQLIDDLLNLSRVTRTEMKHEQVDLSIIASRAAARLKDSEQERQVEFVIADGLVAEGDERLLNIVLENLISNAWKFTGNSPHAVIEFGMTRHDGKPEYFVKDNGAGFDMAYADKLFSPFQRLHSSKEYPGTGIGLATVKRIINRHGGRVRITGEPGKGTVVYFTLS